MSSPQSVFMIGWEYPPHNSGGLGVACEGLTQALADQNTQVYFTLPYHHSQPVGHLQLLDCVDPSWEVAGTTPPFSAYGTFRSQTVTPVDVEGLHSLPQSELEQRVVEYAAVVQAQARQKQREFDVIHAHDWMSMPAALEVKRQTGKPLVAHVHSTEYDRIPHGNGSPYITHTEQVGWQQADQIIAVSSYTKHELMTKYGLPANKIAVVHNGAPVLRTTSNPGRHHFARKRPVVVFMGRLTMQKGADFFLQVASQVLQKQPETLFIVAGNGDLYQQLLFKTAQDQLSSAVIFTGFVRDEQRERLLDRADVFVMPSLSEPFGLVALEAAQRHTPVIVSKHTGVAEVLPSALAIDFWDVAKMSTAVVELLSNQGYAERQARAQLQELGQVTWRATAERVKQIYRGVLSV